MFPDSRSSTIVQTKINANKYSNTVIRMTGAKERNNSESNRNKEETYLSRSLMRFTAKSSNETSQK